MPPADRSSAATQTGTRAFSMSIDIEATPDDVWRALTDASEITRWFALQARVTPGKGGSMFWGWDRQWAWESTIDVWEPNRRLTLVENRPAFDVKGEPAAGPPSRLAMEFTLETQAGRTTLRLVHSGFGEGTSWDDELESVSAGWQFELRVLRHYLEHHHGHDRHAAAGHAITSLDIVEAWNRLLSPKGFGIGPSLDAGTPITARIAADETLAGTVAWHNPGHDLFVRVADVGDGVFRLCVWRASGSTGVQVWVTTYDARHAELVRSLGARLQTVVDDLFADARPVVS